MSEVTIYNGLTWALLAASVVTFALLLFVTAPYGRHARAGWGPKINDRVGWLLMESPAPLVFALCFFLGTHRSSLPELLIFAMWEAHYLHRAFVYPLTLRGTGARMALVIMAAGFLFNAINGYLNGRYVFTFSGGYPDRWLSEPRFIAGLMLFIVGFYINKRSDRTLRMLREADETSYGIPRGGLYKWVSSPNYLGEIMEWVGWALCTWSLPALAFVAWAAANLVPRARAHHKWYKEAFPDYPKERKALVPGLW